MNKIKLLGKLLLLGIFFVVLFGVGKHSDTIRTFVATRFGMSSGTVAGARTSLEEELKKNMKDTVDETKEKIMDMKVSEIVNPILRVKKIPEDMKQAAENTRKEINTIWKR